MAMEAPYTTQAVLCPACILRGGAAWCYSTIRHTRTLLSCAWILGLGSWTEAQQFTHKLELKSNHGGQCDCNIMERGTCTQVLGVIVLYILYRAQLAFIPGLTVLIGLYPLYRAYA